MKCSLFLKRFFDIVLSFFALLITIPLWIIIAAAIKIDSKGPVLFLQERRTKNGKVFKMFKFRTMVVGAESMGEGLFSYEGDSRITTVGYFLRRTSLDELPQLINVFLGEMSLIGPRPSEKNELGDYDSMNARYKKRFDMKGGITGLAQCMGRNGISWDSKVNFDNQYIEEFKRAGVLFDLKILMISLKQVFGGGNISEKKKDDRLTNEEAARIAEEEIIFNAHKREDK